MRTWTLSVALVLDLLLLKSFNHIFFLLYIRLLGANKNVLFVIFDELWRGNESRKGLKGPALGWWVHILIHSYYSIIVQSVLSLIILSLVVYGAPILRIGKVL